MSNAHAGQPTPVEGCGQLPFRTLGRHPQMAVELDERARAEAVKGSGIGRSIGTRLVIGSSSCTR
jgi:hypothetical protein